MRYRFFGALVLLALALTPSSAQSPQVRATVLYRQAGGTVAPFALDGTPQAANSGSSSALALPAFSTTYSNDIILVSVVSNGGPVTSITGCSLTFAQRATSNDGVAANISDTWKATASSALSGCVLTVNTTSAAFLTAAVYAFSGIHAAAPFDSNGAIPNTTNTGTNATWTTSNANDILIASSRVSGGGVTASSGFTLITGSNFLGVQYELVSATQSGVSWTWGSGSNGNGSIADAIIQGP